VKTILQLYLILRPGNFLVCPSSGRAAARSLQHALYLSNPSIASFYQVPGRTQISDAPEIRNAAGTRGGHMFIGARLGCFLFAVLLSFASAFSQQSTPPPQPANDMVNLDVVVTTKSGSPIAGLEQQDFTVLENKTPVPINSFRAVTASEAPTQIVIVIDDVNTGLSNIAYERTEIDKFFHSNGGHLANPTALAFLTDSGIKLQDNFSTDGNSLSAALDQYTVGLHSIIRSGGFYSAQERFEVSVKALLELTTHEASRPGRKLILWISPGWPLLSGPGVEIQMNEKQRQQIFSNVVGISNLLRQGRITLYSIDPLGSADFAGRAFWWEAYEKGISKPSQADWGDIALQVLAVQSGGLALTTDNDITAMLQRCVSDAQTYYELSFVPALEQKPATYHHVEVRVAKPGTLARTRQGFYTQP
jgi:VWFA-related protein